mgnify:CR=1 FL=1
MTQRQTVSFLIKRFQEVGIRPVTRHGQNFLVDLNLLNLLAASASVGDQDVVLEVGTGTGGLTALIAPAAAAVVTVEIDRRLAQLAAEHLVRLENVTMLQHDALKSKNTLHPELLAAVERELASHPGSQLKLVSNLPYNIATPIITNLLATDLPVASMTVTIQKELADRMMASPRTKDYSALSIWMQSQCEVKLVRVMPPSVFWPRPKVDSAILHIRVRREWQERFPDRKFFHQFTRSLFFHRRKFLRSVVISAMKGKLDKATVDELLSGMQLNADARAEQLDVATVMELSEVFRCRLLEEGII